MEGVQSSRLPTDERNRDFLSIAAFINLFKKHRCVCLRADAGLKRGEVLVLVLADVSRFTQTEE